jgi:dienelactone hydrolase
MKSRDHSWIPRLLLISAVQLLSPDAATAQSRLAFTLPFGPFAVGFRDLQLFDSSRAVIGSDSLGERLPWRPRPIQVGMWYPATPGAGATPMLYREYVWLDSRPLTFAARTAEARAAIERSFLMRFLLLADRRAPDWRPRRLALLDSARQREFDVPTRAFRDASPAPGAFPLIIYAPGMSSPFFENDILMEYLASHGYVVLASPSWGGGVAIDTDRTSLEAQARDIEFLAGYGRGLPATAGKPVGVVGHSWGGLTNVVAASRNRVVDAVVTLDGSVRYFWQRDFVRAELLAWAPYTTPSLFLNQGANNDPGLFLEARADTQFVFFDSLRYAPAWVVSMDNAGHQNFVASFNRFSAPQPRNFVSDTSVTNRAYEDIARMVLSFFDAHLKSPGATWQPPAPSAPVKSRYSVRVKQALRPLPTVTSFAAAAQANGGLAQSRTFLERVLAANPGYTIPWSELANFAWSRPSTAARAGLFEVAAKLYPTMPDAHRELGDAYLALADTVRAIGAFERVLQLDSTHTYAREQLRKLRP